ncbi:MAG: hypothetical protein EAZ60_24115 [Oscillatoriales cyanobacterium]|nr:MAG: hypothetical protein EAZ83_18290 [Oscillatoriales cyanobacterium]TAE92411.1 MAG: hypothetical protein EAZ79_29955 [Oscillatoriales cyanobacterium]TAF17861.1 MAG: hypothetical protein EAZ73_19805 [Oscillatoriales cyanobacterium]TAF26674.1 MAG: hypothetical protein EAZ69_28765 [Oscillatoriales cyanobacterium]TAF52227.1 MAG: hypothetical protein EAZ60_24115 [Oscillatoriales cyanobacterium]
MGIGHRALGPEGPEGMGHGAWARAGPRGHGAQRALGILRFSFFRLPFLFFRLPFLFFLMTDD